MSSKESLWRERERESENERKMRGKKKKQTEFTTLLKGICKNLFGAKKTALSYKQARLFPGVR